MRRIAGLILLALVATSSLHAQTNRYYATRPSYQGVVLTPDAGSTFQLGSGLDMNDPENPVARPLTAFTLPAAMQASLATLVANDIGNADVINNADTSFFETTSVAEESRTLYAYFKASYKFASASAAYSEAYARKDTHKSTYVIIENKITGPALSAADLVWNTTPKSEQLRQDASSEEVMSQFVADYGTHYISAINYGFRIAIRGSIATTDESMRKKFSAALKAKFGSLKAKGGVTREEEKTLKQATVDLRAVVVSGGMSPANSSVLYGYDQISDFLEELKSGKVSVKRGPISANANSYWHTVAAYPRTREVLKEFGGVEATAPYGVPAGTVIAWKPTQAMQAVDANGTVRFAVPDGWAICDGSRATPDLRDHFIYGTSDISLVGTSGGSATHIHTAHNTGSRFEAHNVGHDGTGARRFDGDKVVVDAASSLPPFTKLMYLMKL